MNKMSEAIEIVFSDADFDAVTKLAKREFGISLAQSKKPLVKSRLSKRLRELKIFAVSSYLEIIQEGGEIDERAQFISCLTTNVTSFFREQHHFDMLRDTLESTYRDETPDRLRFWSAGCSTGQEPYSLAATLSNIINTRALHNVRILATDVDKKVIDKAKAGVYSINEIDSIPPDLRHVLAVQQGNSSFFSVPERVKSLVSFAELNLQKDWPMNGPLDGIFCRNVAIYFDQQVQERLWVRFADILGPKGLLFIGHSERIINPSALNLLPVGVTTYQKC